MKLLNSVILGIAVSGCALMCFPQNTGASSTDTLGSSTGLQPKTNHTIRLSSSHRLQTVNIQNQGNLVNPIQELNPISPSEVQLEGHVHFENNANNHFQEHDLISPSEVQIVNNWGNRPNTNQDDLVNPIQELNPISPSEVQIVNNWGNRPNTNQDDLVNPIQELNPISPSEVQIVNNWGNRPNTNQDDLVNPIQEL
ncbi:hypothetical protein NGG61_16240, partial [Enterococcus casseliflavus]|uniref:hypothetical protein n=1 Tax=Enterococcus casseliflavus TaxID=37734 RepID=UPI002DC01D50